MAFNRKHLCSCTANLAIQTKKNPPHSKPDPICQEEQADKSEKFGRGKRATTKVDYSVFLDESMADSDKAIEAHFEKLNKWQQMFQGVSSQPYFSLTTH